MNREKYINSDDYREGHTDGYREGVNTVLSMFQNNIREVVDDFTELNNKLNEIRTMIVESREESENKNANNN